tara:strand:+ start:1222 stop:1920 length:699 start_codon:yes stop_codon:yes gene_type:complete
MANTITFPKDFQTDSIGFDEVKKNAVGGNIVYLSYSGKQKLCLQTPWMFAPFGVSEFVDEKTGPKYSLDVSFKGMDNDPKIKMFHDKMQELDSKILEQGVSLSKQWFGKKMQKVVLEELFRPVVKPAKDPSKYSPTIKFKINNVNQLEIYDTARNKLNLDQVVSGSQVQAIIECASVWFVNKTFGVTWKLLQLQLKKPDRIAGFSFAHEDDEEEDEEVEEVEVEVEAEEPET